MRQETLWLSAIVGVLPLLPWAWDFGHTSHLLPLVAVFVGGRTAPYLPLVGGALLGLAAGSWPPAAERPWAPPVALGMGNAVLAGGLFALAPHVVAPLMPAVAFVTLRAWVGEWATYETARAAGRWLGWADGALGLAIVLGAPGYLATLLNVLYIPPPLPYPAPGMPPAPPGWVRPAIAVLMGLLPWTSEPVPAVPEWLLAVAYALWALGCRRSAKAVRQPYGAGPLRHGLRAVAAGAAAAPVAVAALTHGHTTASAVFFGFVVFLGVAALVFHLSRGLRSPAPNA